MTSPLSESINETAVTSDARAEPDNATMKAEKRAKEKKRGAYEKTQIKETERTKIIFH